MDPATNTPQIRLEDEDPVKVSKSVEVCDAKPNEPKTDKDGVPSLTSETSATSIPHPLDGSHPHVPIPHSTSLQSVSSSAQCVDEISGDGAAARRQRIFKIIVVGDSNVGKTCLTLRFCSGRFPDKSEATIGVDFRERNLVVGSETIKLQLWDTAGQERYRRSMVQHYYRNVDAVVFVYDVMRRASFLGLHAWVHECDEHRLGAADTPRILIGNKCDLLADGGLFAPVLEGDDGGPVSTNEAQCFADEHCMPLFETSARADSASDHVDAIFVTLALKLRVRRPMMAPPTAVRAQPPGGGARGQGRTIDLGATRGGDEVVRRRRGGDAQQRALEYAEPQDSCLC